MELSEYKNKRYIVILPRGECENPLTLYFNTIKEATEFLKVNKSLIQIPLGEVGVLSEIKGIYDHHLEFKPVIEVEVL